MYRGISTHGSQVLKGGTERTCSLGRDRGHGGHRLRDRDPRSILDPPWLWLITLAVTPPAIIYGGYLRSRSQTRSALPPEKRSD